MVRKANDQDPASAGGQKVKVMQHGRMTGKTQLSGEKARQKGQERNERKGFFQRNAFIEQKRQGPRTKEENTGNHINKQPPQANVAQPASSSASQAQKKKQKPKKAGVMTMTPIGLMTCQQMNPTTGDYSQGDWYNWSYFASVEELTVAEDKHSEDFENIPVDRQTDQNNRFCFSAICLF